MKVFQKSGPSPAMIVAVIALSFAVAGTAVAGTDGLNRAVSKSKVKKIAKKQAKKVLNKREASLNVNSATTAADADAVGGVPASALTVGRSDQELDCFGAANYTCASFTFDLPRPGRLLMISQLPMHPDAAASAASCRLTLDGTTLPNTTTTPGANEDADSNQDSEIANGGVTNVTDVIPAGDHTLAQVCSDTSGNPHFRRSSLSAVLLGTD